MNAPPDCELCNLHKNRWFTCGTVVNSTLPKGADILFVGEAPGQVEEDEEQPFVGRAGQYLRKALWEAGFDPTRMAYANACRCRPPVRKKQTAPTIRQVAACKPFLDEDVELLKPKVIVALGSVALKAVHRPTTIAEVRASPFKCDQYGIPTIVTNHPSAVMQGYADADQFLADLKRAKALFDADGTIESLEEPAEYNVIAPGPDYTETEALEQLTELQNYLLASDHFAWDLETEGLDPRECGILCASFCAERGVAFVVPLVGQYEEVQGMDIEEALAALGTRRGTPSQIWSLNGLSHVVEMLQTVLTSDVPKSGQNINFDVRFTRERLFVEAHNVDFDTMLAHHLLRADLKRHNLEVLRADFTTMGAYDQELKEWAPTKEHSFGTAPNHLLWEYSAKDADCEYRVGEELHKLLNDEQAWLLWEVAMPLQRALEYGSSQGIPIDEEYLDKISSQLSDHLNGITNELNQMVRKAKVEPATNWGSHVQVARVLYNPPDDDGLGIHKEEGEVPYDRERAGPTSIPFLTRLLRSKKVKESRKKIIKKLIGLKVVRKFRDSFVGKEEGNRTKGWKQFVVDGRLYPNFFVIGTGTGRLSSSRPNVQNPPRDPVFRNVIRAKPSHVLIDSDYSAVEARMVAYASRDETYLRDFQSCGTCGYFEDPDELEAHLIQSGHKRLDIHTNTAVDMFHIPAEEVDGDRRFHAKTISHGTNYGRSPWSIAAATNLSDDEAKVLQSRFFAKHPAIREYHKQIGKWLDKHEDAVDAFGRTRRFPNWKMLRRKARDGERGQVLKDLKHMHREAIAMFPQGSTADVLHLATAGLGDWRGAEEFGGKVLVHKLLKEKFGEYPSLIFKREYGAHLCISMHDSLLSEVGERYAEETKQLVGDVMYQVGRLVIPYIDNPRYGTWPNGWYLPVEVEIKERFGAEEDLNASDIKEEHWMMT